MRGVKGIKKALKFPFLLFTLVIPVAIYLFLKGFGENRFEVPIYFEQGIPEDSVDCPTEQSIHLVDFTDLTAESDGIHRLDLPGSKLLVVDINSVSTFPSENVGYPLFRVSEVFANENRVQFMLIRSQSDVINNKQTTINDRFIYIHGDIEELTAFARCQLILLDFPFSTDQADRRLVLLDGKRRIRGYYPVNDFSEIDRMILEMRIILNGEY